MNKGLKVLLAMSPLFFAPMVHADAIGSGEPDDVGDEEAIADWFDFLSDDIDER